MCRQFSLLLVVMALLFTATVSVAALHEPDITEEICDPTADYFLGAEHYADAIRIHLQVVKRHPDNALAHYHLGFAYGMEGFTSNEIEEYERAIVLGLKTYDLFTNLGVARFERGDLTRATDALRKASHIADRAEIHFNLGLIYFRRQMFREAEAEILRALVKAPKDVDYLNELAIIAAEKGNLADARRIWLEILSQQPKYTPAAVNLAVSQSLRPLFKINEHHRLEH